MSLCNFLTLTTGKCSLINNKCPFVYYCNKIRQFKPLESFPKKCKMINKSNAIYGKNIFKVEFEKRGKLYINYNGVIKIISNPFNYIPSFVKIQENNGELVIIKGG